MIDLRNNVLLEDNHLIVINKPSGLLVQPDKETEESVENAIKEYIKNKYTKPGEVFLGVCHRIDRPVSGVVVLARTSKALARLNEMFKTREVKKTYWAVVENKPEKEEGTLIHWMKKDGQKNVSRAYDKQIEGSVKAELSYRLIGKSDRYFLLEVNPVSGRHHQIRVQLSRMGCPIKGDLKYGAKRSNKDGGIHLHARQIEFAHPVKKEPVLVTAPVPDEVIWKAVAASL